MKYESLFLRLIANTAEPESPSGCWVWLGACGKRPSREYPRVNVRRDGKHMSLRPHRVMVEILEGRQLTPTDEVDHMCFNTRCINPDHLEVVTKQTNMARSWERRRDRNKRDNRPENLEVMTQAEHARLHAKERHAPKV